ncbi:MAG: envelope stress response membrane protein PspC [Acetobacteraceae bacterium]
MNLGWQSGSALYRDREHAWLGGVCAGIARYLGVSRIAVRLAAVLALIFFALPTLTAYIALAIVLPAEPARVFASAAEEDFWRGIAREPRQTASALRQRYRELEYRLRRLERAATSEDITLRRRFRDLGDRK